VTWEKAEDLSGKRSMHFAAVTLVGFQFADGTFDPPGFA
jgi:hypothetical protein